MLKLTALNLLVTHTVDIFDLPEEFQAFVPSAFGATNGCMTIETVTSSSRLISSYSSKTLRPPSWLTSIWHADSDDKELAERYAESRYPNHYLYKSHRLDFEDYLTWVKAIRYIAGNVPDDIIKENTLAIYVWR